MLVANNAASLYWSAIVENSSRSCLQLAIVCDMECILRKERNEEMNDDIDMMISRVDKLLETWKWENSVQGPLDDTAKALEMELTKLKLTVGIQNFDELPAYARYLREVSKFLDMKAEKEAKEGNNK